MPESVFSNYNQEPRDIANENEAPLEVPADRAPIVYENDWEEAEFEEDDFDLEDERGIVD